MKNTKLLVLTMMIIACAAGVLTFWDTILTFLFSGIVAYLLNPIVKLVMKRAKVKRGVAVAITFSGVLVLLAFLVSLAFPYLITQVAGLINDLQTYAGNFDDLVYTVTSYLTRLHVPQEVLDMVAELIAQSDSYILSFALSLLGSVVNLSLQIFDLVVIIIVIVYFMLDGPKLIQSLVNFLPRTAGDKVARILSEANNIGKQYIKSRFKISGCMATAIFIGLRCFGIEYAFIFAILSFCLDFIPYFGSLIGCIIQIFYALITGGISFALGVAVYVIIVQQIEGNILAPKIEGNATGIHPITVLFALLAVEQIVGPLGMLISTPLAAILKVVFVELYRYVISDDEDDDNEAAAILIEDLRDEGV
ncbi:MAG: AI-2E family transporter [Clostridia bacterium]|nr:AI-2E family transporter [Clostridia bacterium]